jgi:transcription elongation factor Elf1
LIRSVKERRGDIMETRLLNCPFCGDKIKVSIFYTYSDKKYKWYQIKCLNKKCVVECSTYPEELKQQAIKAWNTRVVEDKLVEALKNIQKRIDFDESPDAIEDVEIICLQTLKDIGE